LLLFCALMLVSSSLYTQMSDGPSTCIMIMS
jgi:hypothetical protein